MDTHRSARDQHRSAVLGLLHTGVHLTRNQIATHLGITRSTVSEVLTDLREEGAVVVSETHRHGGRGRPAEVLCVHPGAARYVGVDYSHTRVIASIANSSGYIIGQQSAAYAAEAGWETRCRVGIDLVRGMEVGDVHFGSLNTVAIGLPGPNSASWDSGIPGATTGEPFHMVGARIREVFSAALGVPVMVDHHIRLAALAEASIGRDEPLQNLLYLRLSTGIGGAVISSGSVAQGAHQLAGEIGHLVVDHSDAAQICRCGRVGCLETVASMKALCEAWTAHTGSPADPVDLEAAILGGDETATALVREAAVQVGRLLGVAALVTDPAEIVLAGEVPRLLPEFADLVRAEVAREVLAPQTIPVRHAHLGEAAGAIGGVVALMANQRHAQLKEPALTPTRLDVTGAPRAGQHIRR